MSSSESMRERCEALVESYLSHSISDEELVELESLLSEDDALLAWAESRLGMDAALCTLLNPSRAKAATDFGRGVMERLTCEEDSTEFASRVSEKLQALESDQAPTKPKQANIRPVISRRGSRRRTVTGASTSRRRRATAHKPSAWKWPLAMVACLAVLVSVGVVIWGGPASQSMSISRMSGEVIITRADGKRIKARAGSRIAPGDKLTTKRGSVASLAFTGKRKGTVELTSDSHLAFTRIGTETLMSLNQGLLKAALHQQPRGYVLTFRTPHSISTVTGTQFTLRAERDRSRLTVEEGSVRFTDLGQSNRVSVKGGYYAVTGESRPLKSWLSAAPVPANIKVPTAADFTPGKVEGDGSAMVYQLFTPPGYQKDYRYPLVVHLHGLGERGNDNQKQIANEANGAFAFISQSRQTSDPAFFVAPQYPPGGNHWLADSHANNVHRIVKKIQATYSIDPDRIYIAGLSFGGFGVWEQLRRFDDTYAAALPVCGALQNVPVEGMTPGLINTPMWNWHGDNDPVVKPTVSITAVDRLRQAGGRVNFSLLKGKGHAIWREVYNTDEALDWLFAQRRGRGFIGKPQLEITSPPTPQAMEITQDTIRISGVLHHDSQVLPTMAYRLNGEAGGAIKAAKAWQFTSPRLGVGQHTLVIIATYPDGLSLSATMRITRRE